MECYFVLKHHVGISKWLESQDVILAANPYNPTSICTCILMCDYIYYTCHFRDHVEKLVLDKILVAKINWR